MFHIFYVYVYIFTSKNIKNHCYKYQYGVFNFYMEF